MMDAFVLLFALDSTMDVGAGFLSRLTPGGLFVSCFAFNGICELDIREEVRDTDPDSRKYQKYESRQV